jgi:hypothetical protein
LTTKRKNCKKYKKSKKIIFNFHCNVMSYLACTGIYSLSYS